MAVNIASFFFKRWLWPDGVKDALFDSDPTTRICNHLSRFVLDGDFQLFKFFVRFLLQKILRCVFAAFSGIGQAYDY